MHAYQAAPKNKTAANAMGIARAAALCFEIWYQSRISIAAASAALAAASSRILIGSIDWRAVFIVVLCTAAAYQTDDVVDFRRDLERPRIRLSANMRSFKLWGLFPPRQSPSLLSMAVHSPWGNFYSLARCSPLRFALHRRAFQGSPGLLTPGSRSERHISRWFGVWLRS